MEILTLGEKIKLKRKEKNMTLKELAGDRITAGQISLVESGKSNPSIDLLEYIAQRLDTDIEYFLESEEKQASNICEFYISIAESAINGENYIKAKETIDKGLHYAKEYNLSYYKGKFDMLLARLKEIKGEYEEAQQCCLAANSYFLKTDNVDDIVNSFILLGEITFKMDFIKGALNYFMQADSILNEYGYINDILKAKVYYYISLCYYYLNDMYQSIRFAMVAKDKLKMIEDKKEYANTLMLLSIAYGEKNNIKEAMKYAKEAKKIFNEIQYVREVADIENSLGVIFAKDNNFDESFEHLNKALKIKTELMDETYAETVFRICDNYLSLDETDKAMDIINNLFEKLKDNQIDYRIKCYEYMFKIYKNKGNIIKSEEILLNLVKYLETLNFKRQLADCYILLSRFYQEINEKDLSFNYMSKGIELYEELGIILHK
ncbi:Helix-turn-helix domain-containing protein [Caloramator quimbayensis]|uniref:Helix-turn-helix domain-containing protein n=1 Tax=Caloramator quimbayensis TaxID=1147123 RepID=A0A1T4XIU7_9CLOT|nr:helix-turn-helix transcriptional regulator [Caloramator quimbayensis]SKA89437.1 Helix-turn-helix domain-containing protein [Caloramator quimbayensis]